MSKLNRYKGHGPSSCGRSKCKNYEDYEDWRIDTELDWDDCCGNCRYWKDTKNPPRKPKDDTGRDIMIIIKIKVNDKDCGFIDLPKKDFKELIAEIPEHVKMISKIFNNYPIENLDEVHCVSVKLLNKRSLGLVYLATVDLLGEFDSYEELYADIKAEIEDYELEDIHPYERLEVDNCEVYELSNNKYHKNKSIAREMDRVITDFKNDYSKLRKKLFKK